jgi:hypothetical protein
MPVDCLKSIDCVLQGGLGNQIFQFCAAAKLYQDLGAFELILNTRLFSDNYRLPDLLRIVDNLPESREEYPESPFSKCLKRIGLNQYNDYLSGLKSGIFRISDQINCPSRSFVSATSRLSKKLKLRSFKTSKVLLSGFWQDPRLHENIHLLSNHWLRIDDKKIDSKLPKNYVAIHVRRGDYADNLNNSITYCSRYSQLSYILTSINILPSEYKNLPIIVCSDDPDWCRIWIQSLKNNGHNITHSQSQSSMDDWLIINRSLVSIIPNSTFSFTAAWLNRSNLSNKLRVILPQWYDRKMTMQEKGWESIPGAYAI